MQRINLPNPSTQRLRALAVSLSAPVAAMCPARYARALVNARAWFDVAEGRYASAISGRRVAPPSALAEVLTDAWWDSSVDVILSVIGGTSTAEVLEWLPLEDMAAQPKLVVGYSDTTALFAALGNYGVPAIYGPALMPQFGEYGGPHAYTMESLFRALSPDGMGTVAECADWIEEHLEWDQDDVRPRTIEERHSRQSVRPGKAKGRLFAANMGTLLSLAGTRFFPDLSGVILIVEEDEVETPSTIERMLVQLRMIGTLGQIGALMFGRLPTCVGMSESRLREALLLATEGKRLPVCMGVEVGHVDPMHAIPIGASAELTVSEKGFTLNVLSGIVSWR